MSGCRETIDSIISIEWDMFTAVNEGEPRAACQDDKATFQWMRGAQFDAWSAGAATSYLNDLESALREKRNLAEEKYIHMMKDTAPAEYRGLLTRITPPSDHAVTLAQSISDIMLSQTRELFDEYPFLSGHGRPLYSELDSFTTSVETYQLSELLTYSEATLASLKDHVLALEGEGISIARTILENTVRFYGYESLDDAEAAAKSRG